MFTVDEVLVELFDAENEVSAYELSKITNISEDEINKAVTELLGSCSRVKSTDSTPTKYFYCKD